MNKLYFTIVISFFLVALQNPCTAQKTGQQKTAYKGSFALNGKITLDSLTRYVHRLSKMRFSFNSSKVKGSKEINFPKQNYSSQELLERVRKTTSLHYTFYDGYVIFQDNPQKKMQPAVSKQNVATNSKLLKTNNSTKTKIIPVKAIKDNTARETKKNNSNANAVIKDTAKQEQAAPIVSINSSFHPNSLANSDSKQGNNKTDSTILSKNQVLPDTVSNSIQAVSTTNKSDTAVAHKAPLSTATLKAGGKSNTKKVNNFQLGLQWSVALPLHGTKDYFTGTNGKSQPYLFLFPEVWLSYFLAEKHELLLAVIPAQQYFAGNKVLNVYSGPRSQIDSTIIKRSTILSKTSGFAIGLQYNNHITTKWQLGVGISYYWQKKALLNQQTTRLLDGSLLADSLYGITKSSADWQYLNSSFIIAKCEFAYTFKKTRVGISVLVPLSNISSTTDNTIRPINGQLFLRWRIK